MAERFNTTKLAGDKAERYAQLALEIAAVLDGESNRVARMASVTAMLAAAFEHFFWTGFYLVDPARPDELVIGPYQGSLGWLRIALGRGVCGKAAAARKTFIVDDVTVFEDHIACDPRSASEIVVPAIDSAGGLIGVLDVDSTRLAAFDGADREGLERIVRQTFAD